MRGRRAIVGLTLLWSAITVAGPDALLAQARRHVVAPADRSLLYSYAYMTDEARAAESQAGNAVTARYRHQAEGLQSRLRIRTRELASAQRAGRRAARRGAELEEEVGRLRRELGRIAEAGTAELTRLNRDFDRRLAALISTAEDLLQTPRGRRAVELVAEGGEESRREATDLVAQELIDQDRTADRVARLRRAGRYRTAANFYQSVQGSGRATTAEIIRLFETVVGSDPASCWDWIELARLYENANRAQDFFSAATEAEKSCTDERHRTAALDELGRAHRRLGRPDLAIQTVTRALNIRERLASDHPLSRDHQDDLAVSHNQLGDMLVEAQRNAEALSHHQRALDITRRLAGLQPNSGSAQRAVVLSLIRVIHSLILAGSFDEAAVQSREVVAIAEGLAVSNPTSASVAGDLALAYEGAGRLRAHSGDREGAIHYFSRGLGIMERLAHADPESAVHQRQVGVFLWALAVTSAPGYTWRRVVDHFETMRRRGFFYGTDQEALAIARDNAAAEASRR